MVGRWGVEHPLRGGPKGEGGRLAGGVQGRGSGRGGRSHCCAPQTRAGGRGWQAGEGGTAQARGSPSPPFAGWLLHQPRVPFLPRPITASAGSLRPIPPSSRPSSSSRRVSSLGRESSPRPPNPRGPPHIPAQATPPPLASRGCTKGIGMGGKSMCWLLWCPVECPVGALPPQGSRVLVLSCHPGGVSHDDFD